MIFRSTKPAGIKKILVIRFSSIGDIVLTSPVIRCLKEQLPGTEIHYLTKKKFASLVSANPNLDKVLTIENSVNEIFPQIKKAKYDFIVDLHRSIRSRILVLRLMRPSATFPKLNIRKWFLVKTKINLLPDVHICHRYFRAVRPLGVQYDGMGLDYFIAEDEKFNLNTLPISFLSGFIAVAVGSRHATKQLPIEKLTSVLKDLNYPVVLLGGEEDFVTAKCVSKNLGENVVNCCGKLSFGQSASLIQQSRVLLTGDTGMMHIAAALKKPVVSVWGNTVPEFGMYPFYPDELQHLGVVVQHTLLKCRPCSKLGFEKCPKKHFRCMKDIPDEIIVAEIRNALLKND